MPFLTFAIEISHLGMARILCDSVLRAGVQRNNVDSPHDRCQNYTWDAIYVADSFIRPVQVQVQAPLDYGAEGQTGLPDAKRLAPSEPMIQDVAGQTWSEQPRRPRCRSARTQARVGVCRIYRNVA